MYTETEHFALQYDPRDQAVIAEFAAALEEHYDTVCRDTGEEPGQGGKYVFRLCGDAEEYIAATGKRREDYQPWMVGNSDPGKRQICVLSPRAGTGNSAADLKRVAVHELTHLLLDEITRTQENEAWLAEGIAILYAGQTDLRYVSEAEYPEIAAISGLCVGNETPEQFCDNGGYDYAGIYVWYFIRRYGFAAFLAAYRNGVRPEEIYPGFEREAIREYRKEFGNE